MQGFLKQISRSNGGLPKLALPAPAMMNAGGIVGDRQRNLKYHGGPDKAVLMIAAEVVDDLAMRGYPVSYGAMGENLTVAGLDPKLWRAGQQYRIGKDALIELTTLRQPCLNLDVFGPTIKRELYDAACRAANPESKKWARGGFYARVICPGLLEPGAAVSLVEF